MRPQTPGVSPFDAMDVSFQTMDNSCRLLGSYSTSGCGVPQTIKDSFLESVLSITNVWASADSDAYFGFKHANGVYFHRQNLVRLP